MGGGGMNDMGIYNVHLASVAFWRQKPTKIVTTAVLNNDGVDLSSTTTLVYPHGGTATSVTNLAVDYPNDAFVAGTKGTIHVSVTTVD
jgi:predicted dehydrogenase